MASRVALFIDYQNVYKCAREAFEASDAPGSFGQIDPMMLGRLLVARPLPPSCVGPRVLTDVRVYVGRPSQQQSAKGYAASRRQAAAMEQHGVKVIVRTLRSRPNGSLEEKGVDVSLAIDFVAGAVDGAFDVGIIFSTDTDLIPALEFVANRPELSVVPEVASWSDHKNSPLFVDGKHIWCHRLSKSDYHNVQDRTVYAV